jgi:hypothetical protein
VPVAAGARIGESGCKGCLWVRGRLGKLTRLTAEAESSPKPRRKEEDGADGRDPPVSDRVREREMALGAGSARAGLGRDQVGRPRSTARFFLFLFV